MRRPVGEVYCVQKGVVAAAAKEEIARIKQDLAGHEDEDCDTFADLEEDEEELEHHEIVVDDVLEE